jgi:beta-ribofuranosylaminobenzene 5'-phosphate synthase
MMAPMHDSVVITTGARLHFGFFAHRPAARDGARNAGASSVEVPLEQTDYGGIGLMIDSPSFVVATTKDDRDRVICSDGSAAAQAETSAKVERVLANYRRASAADRQPPPSAIEVRRRVSSHSGLGSGTQLAMAVAQSLALLSGDGHADAPALARRAGRGKRSAIGIHGFGRGGFLVDGGKRAEDEIGRLVARIDVPSAWRFLLISPAASTSTGLSGQEEVRALAQLPGMPLSLTEHLSRLALLEILPALEKADGEWFGEALYQFGRSVGDYFRPVQGGRYADPQMAALVDWLRSERVRGIAQTSWGPTIAVCCEDAQNAASLHERILANDRWKGCHTQIVAPLNTGAAIQL